MPTPASRTGPKSKSVPRGRGKRPGRALVSGEDEAGPSEPNTILATSNEATSIARSTRSATKSRVESTRELRPRLRSVTSFSQPDCGTSRPRDTRTASTSRTRGHPYPPLPWQGRSSKVSGRAESVAIDGLDAVDGKAIQPPEVGLAGTDPEEGAHGILSALPAIHVLSAPPASSSSPSVPPPWNPSPLTHLHPTAPPGLGQPQFATSNSMVNGTSYFPYAHHVNIGNLNAHSGPQKTLFEYLSPHVSHGAAHDSNERCAAPACHAETRVAIRQDVMSWIEHGDEDDEPKNIMWLSGPAGGGKTAIAGSVATACKEQGLLAASFFFSSFSPSKDRSSKSGLVATLAHHMSQNDALHRFSASLLRAVERHPDIFHKNLKEQTERLLLEPFRTIRHEEEPARWPKVIIIDGLDEVIATQHHDPTGQQIPRMSEDDQVEILNILLSLSQNPAFPFRIFVASRPERNIADFFTTEARGTTIDLFLDSKYNPDADVERFFVSKFAHIRRRAGISSPSWPGQPVLDRLVEMSSGQFIVPATIIRWVEAGVPQLQLAEVLQLERLNTGTNPFATLDALYRHILKRAHNTQDNPLMVMKWIHCITTACYEGRPGVPNSAQFWRQFLENVEGELNYRLGPITSLISVPPPNDMSSPIMIYHKSLTDFLSSPTRCGDLYVPEMAYNSFVADRTFLALKNMGPAVPPSVPADLAGFLKSFFHLKALHDHSPTALAHLSESSKAELASCDVAWWTTVSLSTLYSDGSGLLGGGSANSTGSSREGWGDHAWVVRGIYTRIHQAMGCNPNTVSSTKLTMPQVPGSKCHAACIHWRIGILAKAKELNWCVHKLEGVELDKLAGVSVVESLGMFSPARGDGSKISKCADCHPVPNH